jgi:hypothetical protein
MSETHCTHDERVELDRRGCDGLGVRLLCCRRTNTLSVAVTDERLGDEFELELEPGADALDVFRHPYAHAAWAGVDYAEPLAAAAA